MTAVSIILIVLSGCVLGVWITRHILITAEHRQGLLLRADRLDSDRDLPAVSVIVAAKDEEENIANCVRTMLEQDYGQFELIVANDRSEDRTAEIVREIAAGDERLRLIEVEDLPEGWCGKNNAMQTAIAQAKHEWICMIDADCRQTSKHSLRTAMAYAMTTEADMLSVLPNLEMKGFWENVVQPVCGGIMMIWFNPRKVNDPAKPHAYANGAFMLMRREAYERIGTHAAVRGEVNEDMHMAARIKREGLKLRVIRNEGLYVVRMYTSLRNIIQGWSRIFFGTFGTLGRLTTSLAVLVMMGLMPYAAAGFAGASWAAGAKLTGVLLACGLVGAGGILMQFSVIFRFYRLINARAELAWTYPIGCVVGIVALILAIGKLRRGARVTWRNTTYTS